MTLLSACLFILFAVLLVLASWWIHRDDPEATATTLFDRMLGDRAVRVAVTVIWWWLGWHFLAGTTL